MNRVEAGRLLRLSTPPAEATALGSPPALADLGEVA